MQSLLHYIISHCRLVLLLVVALLAPELSFVLLVAPELALVVLLASESDFVALMHVLLLFVMPFAISDRTYAAISRRPDRKIRIASVQRRNEIFETSLDDLKPSAEGKWERYICGVIWAFGEKITNGLDIWSMAMLHLALDYLHLLPWNARLLSD